MNGNPGETHTTSSATSTSRPSRSFSGVVPMFLGLVVSLVYGDLLVSAVSLLT